MSSLATDLIIRHGTVIDGTGAARVRADVAVTGDRITAIGDLSHLTAGHEIDATGRIVAPGFIDVHTHDDRLLLSHPAMTPKLSQGVTTVVTGNCGISLAPLTVTDRPPPPLDLLGDRPWYRFATFAAYIAELKAHPPAINTAPMVGHSTLRVAAMADVRHPASPQEIEVMRSLLQEALEAGAIGFSTGLFYPTNKPAPQEEVIALAALLAPVGGIYTTHMRDEADDVEKSLDETFATAQAAGVPVVISHHKCSGRANWGRSVQTLQKIDQARSRQPVGLDVYPYAASSTVLMPELMDDQLRTRITWSEAAPEMAGQDLSAIAQQWNCTQAEAAARLQPAGAVYFQMDEADVQRILAYPHSMIGSDGLPHDRFPHPRLWGAFPRVLGHYARDLGLFSLEEAVHRMTGLSATQFRLRDRGVLQPGACADITIFDADTILDQASFEHPTRHASGIEYVVVNGAIAWTPQGSTDCRTGRVLQRPD
ncbi:amidohydrolase family protein [Halomicronema sp. CCY15110]|uniref:N-acyl-D-amino-acid deacylase family protein n=1 Tax=Halomicronema sp. CCY15110 TaxID=2767773 RepID=UPI001950A855|nr:D-aminoacylase [Halomicronema sp. CCY15110]